MIIRIEGPDQVAQGVYFEYDNQTIPLGQGGMGVVYEGRCHKTDNPSEFLPVAIKLVTSNDPDLIQRARIEASVVLDHPNLLRMYAFVPNVEKDFATGGMVIRNYVIMERVIGVSLDSFLSGTMVSQNGATISGATDLKELLEKDRDAFVRRVMADTLRGLDALHSAGFIHRDVDPTNLMILEDGSIKLIDFGISKRIGVGANAKLTTVGSLIGKPDYASPEVATGDVGSHSIPTDIYSAGVMMYQLCTGQLPFFGDNSYVLQMHIKKALPVKNIPNKDFRKIITKATRKNRMERYQSAVDMLHDVTESTFTDGAVKQWKVALAKAFGFQWWKNWMYGPVALAGFIVGIALVLTGIL